MHLSYNLFPIVALIVLEVAKHCSIRVRASQVSFTGHPFRVLGEEDPAARWWSFAWRRDGRTLDLPKAGEGTGGD